MAKTVSLPAAIGANLLLEGKISQKGVIVPTTRDIYEPILSALKEEGLEFNEERVSLKF
jgi:saccharopine dehydrogenase-like NADP-dependent oxidoreductase